MKLLGTQTSIQAFSSTMETGGGATNEEKQTSNTRLFMVGKAVLHVCAHTTPVCMEEGRSFKKRNFLSAHVSGNFLLAQVIAQGKPSIYWVQP